MFPDRIATTRSDDTVERHAQIVRQWGQITSSAQFNIIHLLEGSFRYNLPFRLNFNFNDDRLQQTPAFVTFSKCKQEADLFVRKSIWNLAEANQDKSRFVIAHEMGHLKMHQHDALGFSETNISRLLTMQEEDRAEPQANKFADRLLVEEKLLNGFYSAEEIAEYFNVPIDCAERRFFEINDKARRLNSNRAKILNYTGEACPKCANFTLVQNGTYQRCSTTGCS